MRSKRSRTGTERRQPPACSGRRLIDTGLAHPRPERPASTAGVTVVVPVRDRPRQLRRCLQALGEGTPIVVVDDGSRDHEAVLEVARDHRAAVLRHRFPAGPGAARNTGLTAREDRARGVPRQRLRPERGMARCADRPLRGSSGGGRRTPRAAARRYLAARCCRVIWRPAHRSTSGPTKPGSSSVLGSRGCRRRPWWSARARWTNPSTRTCATVRMST